MEKVAGLAVSRHRANAFSRENQRTQISNRAQAPFFSQMEAVGQEELAGVSSSSL